MLEPFVSPRLLIDRAREHLNQFDHVERTFAAKRPYTIFKDIDPEAGDDLIKVHTSAPPDKLSVIAFDIINCLRSSLDHSVFDASRALGNDPKPKYTKFPMSKDPAQLARDLERKDSQVPEVLRSFLLGFEPYQGGTNGLWELNEIRNGKIHQILASFPLANLGVGIGNGRLTNVTLAPVNEWDPSASTLTVLRLKKGSDYEANFNPTVIIAFGQIPRWIGQPASGLLREFTKIIDGIRLGLEAEVARLKS